MRKRALIILAVLGLASTACISSSTPPVDYGQGQRFVPFVVDSTDDVGQGDAIALTADGAPYVSYFGFPAKLAEGEIAVPRPLGAPALPGVLLSTADTTGLWQRGAVNTIKPDAVATGVNIPFGPVETPSFDLTPDNGNGTAIALAGDGTVHVAWTMGGAVYVATTKLGGTSTVEKVFDLGSTVSHAGPIGRPGITLDGNDAPWIAFTVESSAGRQVHVAHLDGSKWVDDIVATSANCNGCTSPQPTGIGVVGDAPVVVFVNAESSTVESATLRGGSWTTSTVASSSAANDAVGLGLAFATDGKGAFASFFGGDGTVQLATLANGAWTTSKVAEAANPTTPTSGNLASTTAVAVDGSATVYVAWQDQELHLVSGKDNTFTPVDLGHTTANATGPSLATSDAGVALGWYDTNQQNQMIGFFGDLQDLLIAQPSPSLTVSQAPATGSECGKDGKPALDVVAKGIAFDTNCLVAVAGKPFELNFDNQDSGIQHNVAIYTDSTAADNLFRGDITTGVATTTYKVGALDAGTYYFQCDIHPTMNGQFVVVKG
jgi:plastocyanin